MTEDAHPGGADGNEDGNEGYIEVNVHNDRNAHIAQDMSREEDLPAAVQGDPLDVALSAAQQSSPGLLATERAVPRTRRLTKVGRRNLVSTSLSRRSPKHGKSRTEVEAVVSCSSDGLVVVLRHARPCIPQPMRRLGYPIYDSGRLTLLTKSIRGVQSTSKNAAATTPSGPEPEQLTKTIREAAASVSAGFSAGGSRRPSG